MLRFSLLSDAYTVALFGAAAPRTDPAPRDGYADSYDTVTPEPGADEEEDEEEDDAAPDESDDLETARTRPLRLDQIHL